MWAGVRAGVRAEVRWRLCARHTAVPTPRDFWSPTVFVLYLVPTTRDAHRDEDMAVRWPRGRGEQMSIVRPMCIRVEGAGVPAPCPRDGRLSPAPQRLAQQPQPWPSGEVRAQRGGQSLALGHPAPRGQARVCQHGDYTSCPLCCCVGHPCTPGQRSEASPEQVTADV